MEHNVASQGRMEPNVRNATRCTHLAVLLPTLAIHAWTKSYLSGKLADVTVKDMTTTISIPISTGTGNGLQIPLHMGINYQFEISPKDLLPEKKVVANRKASIANH